MKEDSMLFNSVQLYPRSFPNFFVVSSSKAKYIMKEDSMLFNSVQLYPGSFPNFLVVSCSKAKKNSPSTKLPLEMSCFQAIPLFIKYLSMSLPSIAYLRPLDFKYRVQGVPIYG